MRALYIYLYTAQTIPTSLWWERVVSFCDRHGPVIIVVHLLPSIQLP